MIRAPHHPFWMVQRQRVAALRSDTSNPLVGLETRVLKKWLEHSSNVRAANGRHPAHVENAVREIVWETLRAELQLRSQGMPQYEAEKFTRPAGVEASEVSDDVGRGMARQAGRYLRVLPCPLA